MGLRGARHNGNVVPHRDVVFLAPNESGSLRLIAPLSSWNVRDFAADRTVRSFIGRTQSWFDNWVTILRNAMENGMAGPNLPMRRENRDPAYPA